jgi:hypothetical protein
MKTKTFVSALLFTCSTSTFAAPVTLLSTWNVWRPSTQVTSVATLTFTYEDTTTDSSPANYAGDYGNALTALTLTMNDEIYSLNDLAANRIRLGVYPTIYTFFQMQAGLKNGEGELFNLAVSVEGFPGLTSDSLVNFKNEARQPNLDTTILNLVAEGDSFLNRDRGTLRSYNDQFSEVPVPGALYLFGSAIAAITAVRRRNIVKNRAQ